MLSAGSWGTTMAKVFADAGSDVTIHARRPEVVAETNVRHQNARYLPDVVLPDRLRATVDPVEALAGARHAVLSIPAQALRANLAAWAPHIEPDAVVVSSMKGVETYSGMRTSEVIHQVTGISFERIAVLSGPNLAREPRPRPSAGSPARARVPSPAPAAASSPSPSRWPPPRQAGRPARHPAPTCGASRG
ncbi:NAD(P)-binding domain-containing protein [Streptomyces sp. NBC_01728]|uniref:2-dehydropantoate 2-reductase N-terminal domain-containing protein n=1 Tax=Streptomyces sp. NBC_01719 TaxID=2975920 RepID=UPI002259BA50|nr:2-dehydropantoate 2-reductase N-terminal domain-containing protein [Streptomyces sp. NBC_01719]MCX4460248.1 NAD(P)-binding domain-containing protein [Streptomyces sp. NBC_01719]MCX4500421.1 NAD(P)-binding domain-containing protein [Streptomyces sp. NBC_01728]